MGDATFLELLRQIQDLGFTLNLKSNLVHGIKISIAAVPSSEIVVSVGPDGRDGRVTALRNDASERPGFDQIPSKDNVLDENVVGFSIIFSSGISFRCRCGRFGTGGVAAHVFDEMPLGGKELVREEDSNAFKRGTGSETR